MSASDDRAELGELIVQLGLSMTMAGESVNGVQDRLYRIAAAKGFSDVAVIAFPTSLFVELGSAGRATVQLGVPAGNAPRLDQVSDLYELVGELERDEVTTTDGVATSSRRSWPLRPGSQDRSGSPGTPCCPAVVTAPPARWGGLLGALVLGVLVGILTTWRFMSLSMILP